MIDLLATLGNWNWLIAGLILVGVEMLAPGVFMLWLGLAALLVGLLSFVVDWSWQLQLLAFAAFALAAVPLYRRLGRRQLEDTDQPFLNRRADALVGQVFTLEQPIVDGAGTVRVGDTVWRVAGPDTPAGNRVRIVTADGAALRVEPA
ncbi:MAG: NfeD family protein [Xanthobacteraceae bacterium]|nr:NfeD family protein [Xanthobacteraceae bacterium]